VCLLMYRFVTARGRAVRGDEANSLPRSNLTQVRVEAITRPQDVYPRSTPRAAWQEQSSNRDSLTRVSTCQQDAGARGMDKVNGRRRTSCHLPVRPLSLAFIRACRPSIFDWISSFCLIKYSFRCSRMSTFSSTVASITFLVS